MSELTLLLLRIGFLVLMWFFVFAVVYSLRADLFGVKVRTDAGCRRPPPRPGAAAGAAPPRPSPPSPPLDRRGARAEGDDRDRVAHRHHERPEGGARAARSAPSRSRSAARANRGSSSATTTPRATTRASLLWGEQWMIQDLDSTNGTWHDGARVATAPRPVVVGAPIKVGATTFELRK